MEIIQFIIFIYLILTVIFTGCFYLLIMYPNKFVALRYLLSYMYWIKNIKSNDIIYQTSLEGCGLATIQMLFNRLKPNNSFTNFINLNSISPMDMNTMSEIIESSGLKATGYEFQNKREFESFIQSNPNSSIIMLMKRYDNINQISLMKILFFPVYIITEILIKLKLINYPDLHWVILDKLSEKEVVLSDPFFGKILLTSNRFKSSWSKYALIINK